MVTLGLLSSAWLDVLSFNQFISCLVWGRGGELFAEYRKDQKQGKESTLVEMWKRSSQVTREMLGAIKQEKISADHVKEDCSFGL